MSSLKKLNLRCLLLSSVFTFDLNRMQELNIDFKNKCFNFLLFVLKLSHMKCHATSQCYMWVTGKRYVKEKKVVKF